MGTEQGTDIGDPRTKPPATLSRIDCILAIRVGSDFVPVGIGSVLPDENGLPDTLFERKKVTYECGHHYWTLIGPSTDAFAEELDQYVLWRGSFARVGESLVEWFMHKVHEGETH